MESVKTLVIGAGVSGLSTAGWLKDSDYLVLEADREIGGYCKTVKQDGFVWDYSGHFFHFKHKVIEQWLKDRMAGQRIREVKKRSFVHYKGRYLDFPFQKNIHQLPQEEFIECLYDLFFARGPALGLLPKTEEPPERNFKEMLYAKFGRGIAEKFLIPYNEKLYATDLSTLDKDAMGRFFPYADLVDIVRNMKGGQDESYNATFTYPEGGAIEYVKALYSAVKPAQVSLGERLVSIDVETKTARTDRREIRFERLVSSAPFNRLLSATGANHDPSVFTWNKVLVFNLGFDRKGKTDAHWVYYPGRDSSFYRLGYYDNIFDTDRLSLYVELGYPKSAAVDVPGARKQVLADLKSQGVIDGHQLVAEHSVVMDPAYVHITTRSVAEVKRLRAELSAKGIHSIGRYGGWTYCSIEDNIVEARALAESFG